MPLPHLISEALFNVACPSNGLSRHLEMSGVATLRKQRLSMELAIWLVLGVALLHDCSIPNVAEVLDFGLT